MKRVAILFLLLPACHLKQPRKIVWADDQVEVTRLAALLPDELAGWKATAPAHTSIENARLITERKMQAPRLVAERVYEKAGQRATIDLVAGELAPERVFLTGDEAHPFPQNTVETWHTIETRGRRTRIGESPKSSEAYVQVDADHTIDVVTVAGEAEALAAAIELEKI